MYRRVSVSKSNADGTAVAAEMIEALQAIDYLNNATIADLLTLARYAATEKLNKKTGGF